MVALLVVAAIVIAGAPSLAGVAPHGVQSPQACGDAACVFGKVRASGVVYFPNETPIVADPTNHRRLLTAASDYGCATGEGYYATSDAGVHWTRSCGSGPRPGTGSGEPAVGYDAGGVAYRGGTGNGRDGIATVFVDKSYDHGLTWSRPVRAVEPLAKGYGILKPFMGIDVGPNSPRRGAIYISATQDSYPVIGISVSRSVDGGEHFKTVLVGAQSTFPDITHFSDLAIGPDGTVYASWMHCTAVSSTCAGTVATIMLSRSTDGGRTWSTPSAIHDVVLGPGCGLAYYGCVPTPHTGFAISEMPSLASDDSSGPNAGRLYVVDYTTVGGHSRVEIATSSDGGRAWGAPHLFGGKSVTDQCLGWVSVSDFGAIGLTRMQARATATGPVFEEVASISADGGRTFRERTISTQPSRKTYADVWDAVTLGDFGANVWAGRDLFAAWTSGDASGSFDVVGGLRVR
jgi:hypothetical protein